jgi:hypothetical protein
MPPRNRLLVAPRCVQCRTCANYIGHATHFERRVSERSCAAGRRPEPTTQSCESYVNIPRLHWPTRALHPRP